MCSRFFLDENDADDELQAIMDELQRRSMGAAPKWGEVRPADTAAVIANSRAMIPAPFAMKWGYALPDGKLIINARSETAAMKPMFRDGMAQRRCLVPASCYFEWEKQGAQKIKYAIGPCEAGGLYMAGLYRIEAGKAVFSILTRAPAENIAFIHSRMPVILPAEAKSDWLCPRFAAADVLRAAVLDVRYRPEIHD